MNDFCKDLAAHVLTAKEIGAGGGGGKKGNALQASPSYWSPYRSHHNMAFAVWIFQSILEDRFFV